MAVLNVNNLKMDFAGKLLFSDASFEIGNNDKAALIGSNGSGKTTLLRLISGELSPSGGGIFLSRAAKIGYVEQHACTDFSLNAYEEILKVFSYLSLMGKELESLPEKIEAAALEDRESLIREQAALLDEFQSQGGLTYRQRARSALLGLGFTQEEIPLNVGALSGGQKTKISLGKLLLSDANFILLDEPTNHLDIKSVEWLEDFLSKYGGAALIISHDRYFLDSVTNKTIQITNNKFYSAKGNYSAFMKIREEQKLSEKREYEKTAKEIKRIEGIIEQQKRFNRERNYITIASKQKQIDRLESDLSAPDKEEKHIRISFDVKVPSGNEVIIAESLAKSFDGRPLFKNVSLDIRKGERVFLIGPNGCGKTTLLKTIMRKCPQDSGMCRFGANVSPGYFEQTQTALVSEKTVIDGVLGSSVGYTPAELRNYLAAFLFRGDDIYKKMNELSGGERARVSLLEIMLKGPNLLVLDEPTNHLDIASREVLEDALLGYGGTILCVSHDRYLINRLATKIIAFTGDGVHPYEGNYNDYIAALDLSPETAEKKEKTPSDYKLRKEQESAERKRLSRIKKLEEEIARMDGEKAALEAELSKDENQSDHEKLLDLSNRLHELSTQQDALYEEWLQIGDVNYHTIKTKNKEI